MIQKIYGILWSVYSCISLCSKIFNFIVILHFILPFTVTLRRFDVARWPFVTLWVFFLSVLNFFLFLISKEILCFHSHHSHLCKFIGTKESIYIRKEFNSHRTALGHKHGCRFIVLGHKYGHHDFMWKHTISYNKSLIVIISAVPVSPKDSINCFKRIKLPVVLCVEWWTKCCWQNNANLHSGSACVAG